MAGGLCSLPPNLPTPYGATQEGNFFPNLGLYLQALLPSHKKALFSGRQTVWPLGAGIFSQGVNFQTYMGTFSRAYLYSCGFGQEGTLGGRQVKELAPFLLLPKAAGRHEHG